MTDKQLQLIRIFDFTILGPLMIYTALSQMQGTPKLIMLVSGIGTILLNYHEWRKREAPVKMLIG